MLNLEYSNLIIRKVEAMKTISINRFIDKYAKEYDYRGIEYMKDPCRKHKVKVALFSYFPEAAYGYKNIAPCGITRIHTYAPELTERIYGISIVH